MADLTPYVPRFLLGWEQRFGDTRHEAVEGTLVFADVSGFTRLSERLARAGGKVGAEQMTDVINTLFGDLLMVAARRGGEMLKYGGDALLLLFLGEHHATQGAAACHEMQARLREIGRVETGAGAVRLRMSVGVHSGSFDMFRVGGSHTELVIAGPAATTTCAMEAAADAGEILVSSATAALLEPGALGAPKADGRLLRRRPDGPALAPEPLPPQAHAARCLSPAIAAHLAEGRVDPDHRLATVAFLHLMGVDRRLVAGEPAPSVADALHDTLSVVQDVMLELGVTFLATDITADGTKVMASAGAPAAVEAAEDRMVRALVRIRDAATPLPVRAGTNQGHVFAGDIGPSFRRTFTTIGDVTNTAARVMGQAKPGEVLALRSVLDHVPACAAEARPAFLAKGKTEPLVPYLVTSVSDRSRANGPAARGPAAPMLGRDRELHTLVAAMTAAASGSGRAVEIVGDVGTGKTRLLHELAAQLGAEVKTITLRSEPYQQQTPFFAARHLVRRLLSIREPRPSEEALRKALQSVGAPHLGRWLPLLGDVLGLDLAENDETRGLEGRFRRQRTAQIVEELLAADRSATLLIFEDLHWIDDASADVVRQLRATAPVRPWLVVTTRRPPPAHAGQGRQAGQGDPEPEPDVELAPLTPADARSLVDALAPIHAPLAPHVVDAIVARAGGNPLFLTELVAATLASVAGEALPESLEAVVAAHVDAMPPATRRALRCASVLGVSFDPRDVVDLDEGRSARSVAAVRRLLAESVVADGDRLRFRHVLLRDVVYEALPYRERTSLHRSAARLLERRLDATSDRGVLSLHCYLSADYRKAARYARLAADHARAKYANVEAVALYERCLDAARLGGGMTDRRRASVLEDLGDAANLAALTDRARAAYREARRLSDGADPVLFARLCRKEARLAERSSSVATAARWVQRGLRALEGCDDRGAVGERASLWAMYAWMRHSNGKPDDAVRWAERAVSEARRAGKDRIVASAYAILDGAYLALGRPGDYAERALRIYDRIGAEADEAVTLVTLGAHAYHRGRWMQALRLYERGRDGNARTGNLLDAGFGTFNIAEILVDQGRFDQAGAQLDELQRLWRSIGFALGDPIVDWQRGRLLVRAGQPAEGLELLSRARARFTAAGLTAYVLPVDAVIAEGLLRAGSVDQAATLVDDALARDDGLGGTANRSGLLRLRAYASAALGDVEDAWASMDECLHRARSRAEVYEVALALEGFSVLAGIGGRAWSDDGERARLLDELGVVSTVHPPLVLAEPVET